jgi:uncharacterized membrane protein (UPF0127 family)
MSGHITLSLLFCLLCTSYAHAACDNTLLTLKLGNTTIHAEVVQTDAERGRGLMGRKALPQDWGMWFVMGGESRSAFWMKDTYVALDIIFVGRDMKILHIHPNARPMDLTPIGSPYPYWYTLEVPAGFAGAHHLRTGDRIINLTPKC